MQESVNTRDPSAVEPAVQRVYVEMFPQGNREYIPTIFGWLASWFSGEYQDYLPIDAHYHDLEHTLQGVLCMARLLRARHEHKLQPRLSQRTFELGMFAMLTHDTGYLKRRSDAGGTGAKYTFIHVDRSIEFAGEFMRGQGLPKEEIQAVQNMIRCTGVNVKLESIQFQDEMERTAGYALGTADLLGQMAARDYVDKLPVLYLEFAEAAKYNTDGKIRAGGFFASKDDLIQKTPIFWESYVKTKIERDFQGLYRVLNNPYPSGPNPYIEPIEANMARLRREVAARQEA
jgi:hypothetical protein